MLHPEVRKEVIAEYNRLVTNHPNSKNAVLWEMAKDYVWSVSLADSSLLRLVIW